MPLQKLKYYMYFDFKTGLMVRGYLLAINTSHKLKGGDNMITVTIKINIDTIILIVLMLKKLEKQSYYQLKASKE